MIKLPEKISAIQQVARDWYAERPAAALASLDTAPSDSAEAWCQATILEAAGRYLEAARLFEAIADVAWGNDRSLRLLAVAKNYWQAGEIAKAWRPLVEAVQCAESDRMLSAADRLLARLRKKAALPSRRTCRIALTGTTTLEFWVPALRACLFAAGIDAEIHVGAFGQYRQEILDPGSLLAAFRPDIVLIAADWRSLGLPEETADPRGAISETLAGFRELWRVCRERLGAVVIQHNFQIPDESSLGRLSAMLPGGRARVLQELKLAMAGEPDVAILDLEQTAAAFGKRAWEDPALWHMAKQSPAPAGIPRLARTQSALVRAALGLSSKCLVLDLDGVLWGGVIGEDGLDGIALGGSPEGEAYVAFQKYLKEFPRRGIPLAVCSKNNEEDARLPFRQHPEMALSLDDITVFVANWESKEENLRRIASALNIGLESLVFVDDNPYERSLIRRAIPEIEVPEMPRDAALYIRELDEHRYFEALSLTREDRERAGSYRENAERQALASAATDMSAFLRDLRMRVELRPFDEANLPRIAQLINKTNQFNLTTRRMSEAEVRALIGRDDCYAQFMRLSDRFGDSGLTGVLIAFEEGDTLRIDNWLISCRVLGRRIEDIMLGAAHRHALDRGLRWLAGEYLPTAKNGQVRDIYTRFGFDAADGNVFRLAVRPGAFPAPDYCELNDHVQSESAHGARVS